MPALFGYLCALCLLLGGGYGALSWLAAPEPAHVATKTSKAKHRPYDAQAEILKPPSSLNGSTAAVTSFSADDDKELSSSTDRAPPEAEPRAAKVDLGTRSKAADPASPRQARYASGEVSAVKAMRTGDGASSTEGTVHRKSDRPRSQRTSRRSERKLVLMTLRTIQFPDGRQVTQLIPHRSRERILAFSTNE
jgi:hypothetical protein